MDIETNTPYTKPASISKGLLIGCCGGCIVLPVLLAGFLILLLAFHLAFHPVISYPRTYPVPPNEPEPKGIPGSNGYVNQYKKALLKEEYRSLLIGTWQIEQPYRDWFEHSNDGWEKTRLSILSDGTFVLTDPPEHLDDLKGFRGVLEGEWSLTVSQSRSTHFSPLIYAIFIEYETGEGNPRLDLMGLRTTHQGNTDKQYLRLLPYPFPIDPDYPDPAGPAWKRATE